MGLLDFLNKPIGGPDESKVEPKHEHEHHGHAAEGHAHHHTKTGVKKTIDIVIDEAAAMPKVTPAEAKPEVQASHAPQPKSDPNPEPKPHSGKPIIAITWPISEEAVKRIKQHAEVRINEKEENLTPEQLKALVKDATGILCLLTNKINAEVLEAAGPQLKIVASMSVGFDHIDLKAAKDKGVAVTNTPGTLDNAVAEHTITLILSLAKSIPQADAFVRAGKYKGWDPKLFVGPELAGKTLGIVGLGRIGSAVAQTAKFGLNMKIIYSDLKANQEFGAKYSAKFRKLEHLLEQADVVTIHVPLLPSTKHLINATNLKKMKPNAYLINTSRGPVVDEAALAKALASKTIAGAAIDVYEHEPDITPELLKLDNIVLTPHTASATAEAREAMAQKAADNILAVLAGKSATDAIKSE